MSTTRDSSVSFDQTDTRSDEMNSTIEQWIDNLVAGVDDAQASAEFQEWLDIQSRFHDYSYQNTLLIKRQYPDAPKGRRLPNVAGGVRSARPGRGVSHLDLDPDHHHTVSRVWELAKLPRGQRL